MKKPQSKEKRQEKSPVETTGQIENEDIVSLKPFMGTRPGVYLTAIYSFILILLIFLFLFLPGIRNAGSVLIVKTQPNGAAIRVDDVYMGISSGSSVENPQSRIFLPNGTYLIEAVMPGFEKQAVTHTIKGRVFASLFAPRKEYIELTLKTPDPKAAFAYYAADFAQWSFGGEPTATWQIPMSLSEGAYRAGGYKNEKEELQEILKAASRFTVTRAALRDLLRAKLLLDNFGNAPSPAALLSSLAEITAFLSETPGSAQWLTSLFPSSSPLASAVISSLWYESNSYSQNIIEEITNNEITRNIEIAGLNFINIQAASIILNENMSSGVINIDEFYICQTPVSQTLFETFLSENPLWRDHYTVYYGREIDADPLTASRMDAVTGTTWYAAEAFCKWLSGFLPASYSNMEIRLPSEDEWSIAALSVSNMRSSGWEWCDDPYAPLPFISAKPEAIKAVGSPERTLRGRQSLTSTETRASLPPDFSSPIVTFRPVIARR